jgi:hypothetical protein
MPEADATDTGSGRAAALTATRPASEDQIVRRAPAWETLSGSAFVHALSCLAHGVFTLLVMLKVRAGSQRDGGCVLPGSSAAPPAPPPAARIRAALPPPPHRLRAAAAVRYAPTDPLRAPPPPRVHPHPLPAPCLAALRATAGRLLVVGIHS